VHVARVAQQLGFEAWMASASKNTLGFPMNSSRNKVSIRNAARRASTSAGHFEAVLGAVVELGGRLRRKASCDAALFMVASAAAHGGEVEIHHL
jgi:hypothetical protein